MATSQPSGHIPCNTLPHAFHATADTGEIVTVNDRWVEILGYDRSDVIGKQFSSFLVGATNRMQSIQATVEEDGSVSDRELLFRHADGHSIVGCIAGQYDAETERTYWQFTTRKTSDGNTALRDLKAAVDHAGHAIYITDCEGTIKYVNPEFEEITGYSSEAVVGTTPAILQSGTYDEEFYTHLWETILSGEQWQHEMINKTESGEQLILDQTISPILSDDETIEGFVAVNKDITDRKAHENELAWTNTVLSSLLESLPVGVLVEDANRDILTVNESFCELFGIDAPPEALVGNDCGAAAEQSKDLFADPEHFIRRNEELLEQGEPVVDEVFELKDGRTFMRSYIPYPLPNGQGNMWIYRDITKQKNYESRIEQQRDDLETLNHVLRHDIRNDLQVIMTYIEILSDAFDGDETKQEYLDRILASSSHAIELTEISRSVADVMVQESSEHYPVSLDQTLESEVNSVQAAYPDAVVTYDRQPTQTFVRADEMLGSVFRNILKNAIQHNDRKKREVSVSVEETGESITVRVADNGQGVPDDRKEEIFGKDEKGLDSVGSGIGLYLVHRLVNSYDGRVWVEDSTPTGACFCVELPKAAVKNS